jgi:LysM domain-containing protein
MGVAMVGSRGSRRVIEADRPRLYLVKPAAAPAVPRQRTASDDAALDDAAPDEAAAAAQRGPTPAAAWPMHPAVVASRAGRPRPVRLTRRGRAVVVLFLLGLMVGVAVLLASASQASTPGRPAATVVVHEGDTLWSIAAAAEPGVRPDVAMDRIRRLNHMADNTVYVGEQLTLPPTR